MARFLLFLGVYVFGTALSTESIVPSINPESSTFPITSITTDAATVSAINASDAGPVSSEERAEKERRAERERENREREKQRNRERTDRQTDRQTDRETQSEKQRERGLFSFIYVFLFQSKMAI